MLTKDPNFSIFSDTSGRVTKTYQIDWSRIYSILKNDDFLDIQEDRPTYQRIKDSGIHAIATRTAILPCNDVVKWIIEHANRKDRYFNESARSHLMNFHPDVFVKAYGLKPARHPLDADFSKASKSRFNFDEMLKSWMRESSKFSQRNDDLYPISCFREPYSLLVAMLCGLYSLPNYSFFKVEWAPTSHHVLNTGESFPWDSILYLELRTII